MANENQGDPGTGKAPSLDLQMEKVKAVFDYHSDVAVGERAERYPTDRFIRFELGRIEFELGNYEDAMASFQSAKDEPKLRVTGGHLLGLCFAKEGWHQEASDEFREALDGIDATTRDHELPIRYDLMVALIGRARSDNSVDYAREALEICSSIARKNITYRDIRTRRKELDAH